MLPVKAQVRNGRLIVDEPTDLPEGEVIYLVPADDEDQLDEQERAALDAALEASFADAEAGRVYDADEVMDELEQELRSET
jgi:hypothetical protein